MVSLWEIAVKVRFGKPQVDSRKSSAVRREGFTKLGVGMARLTTLAGLPMHQHDPFDHFLTAQAMTEDATSYRRTRTR